MRKVFDENDMNILSCLRKDARQPLKQISKQVKLPISTIYDRIKKLETNGVIESYTVMIDYKKMQYPIKTTIFLKTNNGNQKKIEDITFDSFHTNRLTKITGDDFNYMVEGIFPNMDKLSQFIDKLCEQGNLEKHKVYYTINEIKKEAFLRFSPHL